ncbi:MAG: pyridoxamine 5'-phosphate oxidase family protein [Pacificimonas sp.]
MTTDIEFRNQFWSKLDDSPFVMLSTTDGIPHAQPMTAQFDDDYANQIFFFTTTDNSFVRDLSNGRDAMLSFTSKGHDFFATVHGRLSVDNDKAKIDKFWSPMVSAWYEDGRDDPKLTLIRMDLGRAEFWEAGTGSFLKMMSSAIFGESANDKARKHQTETRFAA